MPKTQKKKIKLTMPSWFNKRFGRAKSVKLETPPLFVEDVYNPYNIEQYNGDNLSRIDSIELIENKYKKKHKSSPRMRRNNSSSIGGKRKTKKYKKRRSYNKRK